MSKKIPRHQFVTHVAAGIGVAILIHAGVGTIATCRPVDYNFRKLPTNRYPMSPIVLVTYATRASSTMEIGRMVALEIENRDCTVDKSPIERVTSLDGYSHVVIGSAKRMGTPLPKVTRFVTEPSPKFRSIPLAFFNVHLQNSGKGEASRKTRPAYLDLMRNQLCNKYEYYFKSVYDPAKVSPIGRLMGKIVGTPVGDSRNLAAFTIKGQSIFSVTPTYLVESKATSI